MGDGAGGGAQSAESAAMNAARALLQEEEEMQAVHSAKSVAALLKSAKDKIAEVKAAVHPPPTPSAEPRILNEVSYKSLRLIFLHPLLLHVSIATA